MSGVGRDDGEIGGAALVGGGTGGGATGGGARRSGEKAYRTAVSG
ncbi:hypothetical protein [Micromonospora sp. LH3U1]|nr:hypothetical protein [Micromonospora sp. LH3U1]WCN80053.1 hypothetical protein PCA76_24310 [Micromonospora sp. LH3U1]